MLEPVNFWYAAFLEPRVDDVRWEDIDAKELCRDREDGDRLELDAIELCLERRDDRLLFLLGAPKGLLADLSSWFWARRSSSSIRHIPRVNASISREPTCEGSHSFLKR